MARPTPTHPQMSMNALPEHLSHAGLLNDVHRGLGQQMYFWGVDVLSGGNLLKAYGFERHPSPGHRGTSCYRLPWDRGLIELHGHCAGWYPGEPEQSDAPGYLFVRNHRAGYAHQQCQPVVPGQWRSHQTQRQTQHLLQASRHFICWLVEYEAWVLRAVGQDYRCHCHRQFLELPKSRPWLPPEPALRWWQCLATNDPALCRARHFQTACP